jgi:hypothetical protein
MATVERVVVTDSTKFCNPSTFDPHPSKSEFKPGDTRSPAQRAAEYNRVVYDARHPGAAERRAARELRKAAGLPKQSRAPEAQAAYFANWYAENKLAFNAKRSAQGRAKRITLGLRVRPEVK